MQPLRQLGTLLLGVRELLDRLFHLEEEVRYVLEEILKILEFVHENGSIHRDIKPSNIYHAR